METGGEGKEEEQDPSNAVAPATGASGRAPASSFAFIKASDWEEIGQGTTEAAVLPPLLATPTSDSAPSQLVNGSQPSSPSTSTLLAISGSSNGSVPTPTPLLLRPVGAYGKAPPMHHSSSLLQLHMHQQGGSSGSGGADTPRRSFLRSASTNAQAMSPSAPTNAIMEALLSKRGGGRSGGHGISHGGSRSPLQRSLSPSMVGGSQQQQADLAGGSSDDQQSSDSSLRSLAMGPLLSSRWSGGLQDRYVGILRSIGSSK